MNTVLKVIDIIKTTVSKAYNIAPFYLGLTLGYIFKPEIKLAIDVVLTLAKKLI